MLVRKSVPMLAAAMTLLASSTPAYALDNTAPTAGSAPATPKAVSNPADSTDLALELATGGIVVAGGALAAWQLRRRPSRTGQHAPTASGS
jgi:hypothetical protein